MLSPISISTTFFENSDKPGSNFQKLRLQDENSTLESFNYNNSSFSNLDVTLLRSLDSIREKIRNFSSPETKLQALETLSSVDENFERSFDTNIQISVINSDKEEISLNQPEEEEIEEQFVFYEGVRTTTAGGDLIKKEVETSYIIKETYEYKEETLDYTKNEVPVKTRNWKYWVCPCMFKKIVE